MSEPEMRRDRAGERDPESEGISLLDLVATVVKRRWFVIGVTGGISLLLLVFLMVTKLMPAGAPGNLYPDYYQPTVKILVSEPGQGGGMSSLLGQSGLGGLSVLLGGGEGQQTNAKIAESLLKTSLSISDSIAEEFDFAGRYKLTGLVKTNARKMFWRSLVVRRTKDFPVMEIGYRNIDPAFATAVVNRTEELLEARFKSFTLEKVRQKEQYLQESIQTVERQSDNANADLVAFQNKYGIFDISQASESIKQLSSLQAQLISRQLELSLLEKSFPANDARIVQKKTEIAQMQKLISEMKEGSKDFSLGVVAASKVPALSVQYLSLQRDAQIQQSLLGLLKQQYETAKLEEMDTSQTLQVIEKAEVPEVKAGPPRLRTLILVAFGTLVITILISFILEYVERAGRDPVESGKLAAIRGMLARGERKRRS